MPCQETEQIPSKLSEKASKDQVARQIPDTEVLARADMMSLPTLLMKYQLRWTGHVVRMQDTRLPKKLLFGELKSGKRTHGGQKKRFKDTLKTSLKRFNIDVDNWENLAQERVIWWSIIVDGAVTSKSDRVKEGLLHLSQIESRRLRIKDNFASPESTITQPEASRRTLTVLNVRECSMHKTIGLFSHMCTHKPQIFFCCYHGHYHFDGWTKNQI